MALTTVKPRLGGSQNASLIQVVEATVTVIKALSVRIGLEQVAGVTLLEIMTANGVYLVPSQ